MDLPLFRRADQPSASGAVLRLGRPPNARLLVRNAGTGHIRYTDFVVLQAGRKVTELPIFTVLAGQRTGYFDLPRERHRSRRRAPVQADSNAGPIDAAVADAR